MSNVKSKYFLSPTSVLFQPTAIGISIDPAEKKSEDYITDADDEDSDLIPHCKMSWGSLQDRYVPYEIPPDDFLSTSSSSSVTGSCSSSCDGRRPSINEENRKSILASEWGGYGLDAQFWEDDLAPVVRIREERDILFDDLEFCGILSDRLIGAGSSFLAKSPENGLYVLNKCVARDMGLMNVTMLHFHPYLQYIDLSYNHISNLSPLGGVPYLMYLNASHNRIRDVLNFSPPWYLTYVNLSYNYISKMNDVSGFWSIVRLDLSHNAIEVISGLQNLKYMQYLDLSYNLIECIENLDNLNIQELNLEGNCITCFRSAVPDQGLSSLSNLRVIILGYNRLSSLKFFQGAYGLRIVDLRFNRINDMLEVANLKGSMYEIDLRGNPCTQWPNYRDVLLFSIPNIVLIDGSEISATEKVSATTLFASPLNLVAARTVTKLTLLEQLNVPRIDAHVKPYDELSPPLIILTGPSAVKKIALAMHIAHTLSKRVRYCQWHTTRQLEENENEESYIFVSREEFNDITRHGDFLAVQELLGHSYGFHHDHIASLINERKIGITQMDLNAAMQMHRRYSNSKPILVLTKCEDVHRSWIREKFDVYTWIKDSVENLLAVKIGRHTNETIAESTEIVSNFVQEILDEMINKLELPPYCLFVRPQGTGATATDIIEESKTFLPRVMIKSSEIKIDKRHITFRDKRKKDARSESENLLSELQHKMNGLRVIMDEDSNIVIDDKESKRRRQRARILYRRNTVGTSKQSVLDSEDLDDSISSDDSPSEVHEKRSEDMRKPEYLKSMYTELVIQTRNMYLDHHIDKPGFFSLVLLSDNYLKAFNTLVDFIYNLYAQYPSRKPSFSPEINYFKQVAIPAAIDKIVDEIKESMSTSVLHRKKLLREYGVTSWKDVMPSQMMNTQ